MNGLWSILAVVAGSIVVNSLEVYVTPSPNGALCPKSVVCNNLSFYLKNVEEYFKNDTNFIFLNGTHQLPNKQVILKNLHLISLTGQTDTTELQCTTHYGGILFVGCTNVSIRSVTVSGCASGIGGKNQSNPLLFGLGLIHSININMMDTTVSDSSHAGLFISDSYNISILDSKFIGNGLEGNESNVIATFLDNSFDTTSSLTMSQSTYYLDILNSKMASGGKAGLSITLMQPSFLLNINLRDSKFISNQDQNIALVSLSSCQYTLTADTIESTHSHSKEGGSFLLLQKEACETNAKPLITIHNSIFANNIFGSLLVAWLNTNPGQLNISSTIFFENIGFVQSALLIDLIRHPIFPEFSSLEVRLTNLTFNRNMHSSAHTNIAVGLSDEIQFTALISNINDIVIENCTFMNNIGSALLIYNSYVRFSGNNIFENNTSVIGGGLSLVDNAFIIVDDSSRLIFINNRATEFGGAIHVSQLLTRVYDRHGANGLFAYCFFQPITMTLVPGIFYFENNTAGIAGSALYGDVTDNCLFFGNPISALQASSATNVFFNISTFVNQNGNSVVSSGPRRICFCNDQQEVTCGIPSKNYTALPGSYITIPVVIVGNGDGFTPGLVRITNGDYDDQSVNTTSLNALCSNVTYYVTSKNVTAVSKKVFVSIAGNNSNIKYNTLEIDIRLINCHQGFYLSPHTGVCQCVLLLENTRGITCFNTENVVQRSGKIWIGYDKTLNCIVRNLRCPFGYCNFSSVNVTVSEPDKSQCTYNRVGQLCGKCPSNLSLTLGVDTCADCTDNVTILMIVPFAMAGIALVFLLFALNATVSTGTVNGLVFFANIVKILEPLLPIEPIPFLAQFISWINLDFGVTMCFYNGLNACQKIGLQFVFPFYLWLITLFIIILCRRFSKLANILGNQTVPVLATLLLLSYTKMLRTVILIFSVSRVACDNKMNAFWLVDPTIRYCTGCHLLLFLIGLAVMVLVITPFTFFLLLYPVFESLNPKLRQKLSWLLFKLKPFFDAYRGPHNNYFYFYPGLLLLVRIFVAMVVGIEDKSNTSFDILLAVSVILITLLSTGLVYKSGIYLHIIDIMFILGLIVLVYATDRAYSERFVSTATAMYGTVLVLSLSFIMFLCIVFYHVYTYTWIGDKFKQLVIERVNDRVRQKMSIPAQIDPMQVNRVSSYSDSTDSLEGGHGISQAITDLPPRTEKPYTQLREPLLNDDN